MKEKVIIIGAGIAGLTAARELHDTHDVLVLEASARIGGRCHTITHNGARLEMGAAFMQGSVADNPFAPIAAAHGLRWQSSQTERTILLDEKKLGAAAQQDAENFIVTAPKILQENPQFSSVQDYADTLNDSVQELALHMLAGPTETGADLAHLSPHDVADQHETGEFAVITSGWTDFFQSYAAGLNIQFNVPVTAIDWSGGGVIITAAGKTYVADAVIITVPISVLQNITFSPPLPDEKLAALAQLQMGLLNKFFIGWHRSPAAPLPLFWQRDDTCLEVWPHADENIWQVIVGGAHAQHATIDDILAELAALSPDCRAENIHWHHHTAWQIEPFARGAYSYLSAGGGRGAREQASRAVGKKLYFAGEAYDTEYATTVVGAYRSGLAAVQKFLV